MKVGCLFLDGRYLVREVRGNSLATIPRVVYDWVSRFNTMPGRRWENRPEGIRDLLPGPTRWEVEWRRRFVLSVVDNDCFYYQETGDPHYTVKSQWDGRLDPDIRSYWSKVDFTGALHEMRRKSPFNRYFNNWLQAFTT
jgi:hypothetical protein